jgi:hypothetical protein
MAESAKPPVGDTIALLLDSADCPSSIRTAIINHLSELYEQSNLMSPHIVRTLYPMLQQQSGEAKHAEAAAPKAPAPFPLSVAQPVATSPFPPVQPSSPFPPAPAASAPAANPFANRSQAPANSTPAS